MLEGSNSSQAVTVAAMSRRYRASKCPVPDASPKSWQGLAQRLQDVTVEVGQLVEEEDAVMGEADLPRTRDVAAADEARVGDGVVGRTEGAAGRSSRRA
jgi:hypothetical protein